MDKREARDKITTEQPIKVYECVVCEQKIDKGRLCSVCSGEVDEKKEKIISKDHPFLIMTERRTH